MRWRLSRQTLWLGLSAALLATLPVLALQQYRWIGQLSEAERDRMRANLRTATEHFALEFNRELIRAALIVQMTPGAFYAENWQAYARRYRLWMQNAPHPELVRHLYLAHRREAGGFELLRLDPEAGRFEPVEWPAGLLQLQERLEARQSNRAEPLEGIRPLHWSIAGDIPALVLTFAGTAGNQGFGRRAQPGPGPPAFRPGHVRGCAILELDLDYIRHEFLPGLALRHFSDADGPVYDVAVLSRTDPGTLIYSSNPSVSGRDFAVPDAAAGVLGFRTEEVQAFLPDLAGDSLEEDAGAARRRPFFRRPGRPRFGAMFPGLEQQWRVAVKHRSGSLESVIASLRRRNLAISFTVLLLLGAGIGGILVSARRAQKFATMQMEFVAGVSHELLTPLAVIRSAADNLADGVIEDAAMTVKYGELMRNEARRLSEMVQGILGFAAAQARGHRNDFHPVEIGAVIRQAIENSRPAASEAGVEVAQRIESGLPPVQGDAAALERCVNNLLTNALKYGKEGRWVGVSARKVSGSRGDEVEVAVEDRGAGIDRVDLAHLFEPFYRGRAVQGSPVHGTGLGLSFVKRIVEEHSGSVSVRSAPGKGTTFTLRFPAGSGRFGTKDEP
jgi:signal transduction histidine kinase